MLDSGFTCNARLVSLLAVLAWISGACNGSTNSGPDGKGNDSDARDTSTSDANASDISDGAPSTVDAQNDDSGTCADLSARAPAGDPLCSGKSECSVTSGQPDHQGCPNTCSCYCSSGQCFTRTCTAISCSDPPVYR
jgi:hypothetical protein